MPFPFQMAKRNCTRCWRPLPHCVCDAPTLLGRDSAALTRLEQLKAAAVRGAWRGEADRWNIAQRRWEFLLWLVEHGRIGLDKDAAAPSGEEQSGGFNG